VENVLFEVGKGHKIAFNILNLGRWKLGAMTTGGCKGCVGAAAKYANGRIQFKVPISSFGIIKEKLANMAVKTYMSESMMYRMAGMFDDKLGTLDAEAKKSGAENAKAIEDTLRNAPSRRCTVPNVWSIALMNMSRSWAGMDSARNTLRNAITGIRGSIASGKEPTR